MPGPSSYAASSFYSQDSQDSSTTKSLGYTPFEYWKGPKPVAYPLHVRQQHRTRGKRVTKIIGAYAGGMSLKELQPMQPTQLHAAQQYMASLANEKRDLARAMGDEKAELVMSRAHSTSKHKRIVLPPGIKADEIHPAYRKDIRMSRYPSPPPPAYHDVPKIEPDQGRMARVDARRRRKEKWWKRKKILAIVAFTLLLLIFGALGAVILALEANGRNVALRVRQLSSLHLEPRQILGGVAKYGLRYWQPFQMPEHR